MPHWDDVLHWWGSIPQNINFLLWPTCSHRCRTGCHLSQQECLRDTNARPRGSSSCHEGLFPCLFQEDHLPIHAPLWHALGWHQPLRKPTRSTAVSEVISKVKRFEVRQEGVSSQARCALEWEEFYLLLALVHHLHADGNSWFFWRRCSACSGKSLVELMMLWSLQRALWCSSHVNRWHWT